MNIIFHLSLYEKCPVFSLNPFLTYLHTHKPKDALLLEWDNFSEISLQKQFTQLVTDCTKFLLITQAEPKASVATVMPFLEKVIQNQHKGTWIGQRNHAILQKYIQRLQNNTFVEWHSGQEMNTWESVWAYLI
ncbi:MAG: hypothetical protein NZ551_03225 [Microscillaceae bacterium]|nr:hypothetical protein [Microscillaceae bacterium]MDW8460200.1 hypothetical protein [Cytophagales bacterium]